MRKFFAVLLVGCALSLGCGEQPKAIPADQMQPIQPPSDPAQNAATTEGGESGDATAAGDSGEVVAPVEAGDSGAAAPSGETAAPPAPAPAPATPGN